MIGRLRGRNVAVELTEEVRFTFDGRPIAAHRGDTIAAALLRAGLRRLRAAPVDGGPRGMFCCMGLCQDCAVLVDDEIGRGLPADRRGGVGGPLPRGDARDEE